MDKVMIAYYYIKNRIFTYETGVDRRPAMINDVDYLCEEVLDGIEAELKKKYKYSNVVVLSITPLKEIENPNVFVKISDEA